MKKKALQYKDPWKDFKQMILKQVDYFADVIDDQDFYDEVQFHLEEEYFEPETELVQLDEECKAIYFIV